MDDEKVSQVIRDCDAAHPDWKPGVRKHEVKQTREAEERAQRTREGHAAQQQKASKDTEAWCSWIDQNIKEHIKVDHKPLLHALGEVIATEGTTRRRKVSTAIEEERRSFEAKLEPLKQRLRATPGKLPVTKTWRPESVSYQRARTRRKPRAVSIGSVSRT